MSSPRNSEAGNALTVPAEATAHYFERIVPGPKSILVPFPCELNPPSPIASSGCTLTRQAYGLRRSGRGFTPSDQGKTLMAPLRSVWSRRTRCMLVGHAARTRMLSPSSLYERVVGTGSSPFFKAMGCAELVAALPAIEARSVRDVWIARDPPRASRCPPR